MHSSYEEVCWLCERAPSSTVVCWSATIKSPFSVCRTNNCSDQESEKCFDCFKFCPTLTKHLRISWLWLKTYVANFRPELYNADGLSVCRPCNWQLLRWLYGMNLFFWPIADWELHSFLLLREQSLSASSKAGVLSDVGPAVSLSIGRALGVRFALPARNSSSHLVHNSLRPHHSSCLSFVDGWVDGYNYSLQNVGN